jgi:hypothetical protein
MKCNHFITEFSRCKCGIPVARLFRHYFCKRNAFECPFKKMERSHRKSVVGGRFDKLSMIWSEI